MAGTMRVSSETSAFLRGTLKSTRTSTRRPAGSRSRTVFLRFAVTTPTTGPPSRHLEERVHHPVRETPFVVVPGEHLHQMSFHHVRGERLEHAAVRVADHVDRDDRVGAVLDDLLHRSFC